MISYRLGLLLTFAISAVAQQPASTLLEAKWREQALPIIEGQQAVKTVDLEASEYVSVLGNRLAYSAPEPTAFPCRFILYDDNVGLKVPGFGSLKQTHQLNSLPGGIIVVPLSLFAVTTDEAEFSAALARGVAHVALRHFMRTAERASTLPPSQRIPKTWLFSRAFESEADRAAAEILARTGFNPDAVLRYAQNARASFDTAGRRVGVVQEAISKLPPRTYLPDHSPQFDAIKARLAETPVKL
jgi:predicted Zn-dependent protease